MSVRFVHGTLLADLWPAEYFGRYSYAFSHICKQNVGEASQVSAGGRVCVRSIVLLFFDRLLCSMGGRARASGRRGRARQASSHIALGSFLSTPSALFKRLPAKVSTGYISVRPKEI